MNQAAVIPAGNKCEENALFFFLISLLFFLSHNFNILMIFTDSEYCKSLVHMLWNTNKISSSGSRDAGSTGVVDHLDFNDPSQSYLIGTTPLY